MLKSKYRYSHFEPQFLMQDMSFGAAPEPGEPMPNFDLPTSFEGERIRKSDFVGRAPLLLTFGSVT